MRYPILDGFRGYFLLFMMIVHVNAEVHSVLGQINHHAFGWVEDAQGFVFISGIVVGMVYTRILARHGSRAMTRAVFRRITTIYSHQACLILFALVAATSLAGIGVRPNILGPFWSDPVATALASWSLFLGSTYLDILPMYIWFMVAVPLVLLAIRRNWWPGLLALSAALWLLGQTGVVNGAFDSAEALLARAGHDVELGFFFNLLGWQVLFFGGLWLGAMQGEGRLDLGFLRRPFMTWVFAAGLVAFAALGVLDVVAAHRLISPEFSGIVYAHVSRGDLSLLYVAAFYLDLFLFGWLVVAGPGCGVRAFAAMAAGVRYLFTRRALVFLGQHSLHVFSFHVVWSYTLAVLVAGRPVPEWAASLIVLASAAALYLPAAGHAWLQRRGRDGARRAAAPEAARTR